MLKTLSKLLAISVFLFLIHSTCQSQILQTDTLPKKKKTGQLSISTRINSASMFYFTGVAWDNNPTFDVKFVYENKGWGGLFFKSFELTGQATAINYALVVLHKRFYLGKQWMVSPQIGAQINQYGSLADKSSDFLANLAITYKLNKQFTLGTDLLFQNLLLTGRENWTNRLKLTYQQSGIVAAAILWDRNDILGNPGYTNGGIELGYNGIKLSPTMNLLLGFQSVAVFRADTPRKSGVLFSVGVGMN
jgi:hypothetical protein